MRRDRTKRTAAAAAAIAAAIASATAMGTLLAESLNLRKRAFAYCAHNRMNSPLYMEVNMSHSLIFFDK